MRRTTCQLLLLFSCGFAWQDNIIAGAPFSKISQIELRPFLKRAFKQPVYVTPYPGNLSRCPDAYAVVEKPGRIRLDSPQAQCDVLLADFTERVSDPTLEEGLLGLAFPQDFENKRNYYIYYSASSPRRTVIARVSMKNIHEVDGSNVEELLTIRQPFSNHNGGMLEFGPDGLLYIGVGDGGSGGDPRGYAQNLKSNLGKILRIDVSMAKGYAIPKDNPFASSSNDRAESRPEIFAWGLRNPWRFSFSPEGQLIVADVGQNDYEELSVVGRGDNMGWNIMEGFHCFKPKSNCNKSGLRQPFFEYDHGTGQSILGGYVYSGTALPELTGKYIFADSVSGRFFSINYKQDARKADLLIQAPGLWSSFGKLRNRELVVAELQSGKIYQLASTGKVGLR